MEHEARDCSERMPEYVDSPKLHISDHPKGLRRGKDEIIVRDWSEGAVCEYYSRKLTS